MKKYTTALSAAILVTGVLFVSSCKKKNDGPGNTFDPTKAVALYVQTNAKSIHPDESATFNAIFIDANGNTAPATDVTWSSSNGPGMSGSLGTFSGNVFTPQTWGNGMVTAVATIGGKTLDANSCIGVFMPTQLTVVPSAIMWTDYYGSVELKPSYLGSDTIISYTFGGSTDPIASVDSTGKVTFHATGRTSIGVRANGLHGHYDAYIPVVVESQVFIPTGLPVLRIEVNNAGVNMFSGETTSLSATAFDNSNVAKTASFNWTSDNASVATVSPSGQVTAIAPGHAVISATASGVSGRAEIEVLADTVLEITPSTATIPVTGTQQYTAHAYQINRTTKAATPIPTPSGLQWSLPGASISQFDIATVSTTGLITIKGSAAPNTGCTVAVRASSPTIAPGVAQVVRGN